MKTYFYTLGLLSLMYCKPQQITENHDPSLVGTWTSEWTSGTLHRSQTIARASDGHYTGTKSTKIQGRMQRYEVNGTWWTHQDNYYEWNAVSNDTLTYKVIKKNNDQVTFKLQSKEESLEFDAIKVK